MTTNTEDVLVAYCGLVCTNCGMYKKGSCAGCHSAKPKNRHCSMKKCATERNYSTCADCAEFTELAKCRKLNNPVSRFFGFIFHTDRIGNLNKIREVGLEAFKEERRLSGKP